MTSEDNFETVCDILRKHLAATAQKYIADHPPPANFPSIGLAFKHESQMEEDSITDDSWASFCTDASSILDNKSLAYKGDIPFEVQHHAWSDPPKIQLSDEQEDKSTAAVELQQKVNNVTNENNMLKDQLSKMQEQMAQMQQQLMQALSMQQKQATVTPAQQVQAVNSPVPLASPLRQDLAPSFVQGQAQVPPTPQAVPVPMNPPPAPNPQQMQAMQNAFYMFWQQQQQNQNQQIFPSTGDPSGQSGNKPSKNE